MEKLKTQYGVMEINQKGFIKYSPNIKLRTSNIDTFVSCPLQSTLPFEMDVFTANIGHTLHYAHQQPHIIKPMVDNFMKQYKEATGQNDNELRDMLLKFIDKGLEFLKHYEGCIIIFEIPLITQIKGCWIEGHPDVIIIDYKGTLDEFLELDTEEKNKYDIFILDFKTSQNPGSFDGCLETENGIKKAQPYFYSRMTCELLGVDNISFYYYVYTKTKSVKLHIHGKKLDKTSLDNITEKIIGDYIDSVDSGIREPKENDFCYGCPLGPKGNGTCPLFKS